MMTDPNDRRTEPSFRARARLLAALICVVLLGLGLPNASSDTPEDTEEIKEAREEREEARKDQLEAKINLELIRAEDIEVVEALEAATELVNLQQAKVDAAQQRLQAADEALLNAQLVLISTDGELQELQDQAVRAAVETYVGLSDERDAAWLNTDDATVAAYKVALLDTVEADAFDAIDRLRTLQDLRQDALAAAEASRAEATQVEDELAEALVELEAQQAIQIELKAEVDARRERWEQELRNAEAEEQRLTDWIKAEQARIEEELRRRRMADLSVPQIGPGIVGNGGWAWPTAGGVASGFGQRLHPILGYYRMHTGLDIGGAMGQPIWAAHDGVIALAGWNGGYGNTIIVGHGEGTTSLYAHMSGFAVSHGDYVAAGQLIGYVGSTGLSTGPHLHFEVRINGVPVNPRPYLP